MRRRQRVGAGVRHILGGIGDILPRLCPFVSVGSEAPKDAGAGCSPLSQWPIMPKGRKCLSLPDHFPGGIQRKGRLRATNEGKSDFLSFPPLHFPSSTLQAA